MQDRNKLANLLIFSNFIAAFGGGTVLRKGLDVITLPYLHEGSLFAFILGSAIGFVFYTLLKDKATTSKKIESWFSIFCSLFSILLLCVFLNYSIDGQLIFTASSLVFFALLSIRFAFWYYARSIRVSLMIEQKQNMAMVEFSYYAGLIIGLIGWNFFGHIGIKIALIVDVIFQFMAGCIDRYAYKIINSSHMVIRKITAEIEKKIVNQKTNYSWCWKLCFSTAILVIAIQSPIFVLTHYFPAEFNAYVIAALYTGTAIAAILCKHTGMKVEWTSKNAIFNLIILNKKKYFSLITFCFLSNATILSCIFIAYYSHIHQIEMQLFKSLGALFIFSVICSGILLEIFLICFVTQIGIEEENFHQKKMIKIAYGMMVMGLAVGYFLMSLFSDIIISLPCIVILCFLTILFNTKKK